jgi:hypothetical protein
MQPDKASLDYPVGKCHMPAAQSGAVLAIQLEISTTMSMGE